MNTKKKSKNEFNKKKKMLKSVDKKFKVDYNSNENTMVDENILSENLLENDIVMSGTIGLSEEYENKVGKYWEKKTLFSTCYTKGNVEVVNSQLLGYENSESGVILSNSGNKIHFLDANTFQLLAQSKGLNEISYNNEEFISFLYIPLKKHLIACMENSLIRVFEISSIAIKLIKTIKLNKTLARKIIIDPTNKFLALMLSDNSIMILESDNYSIVSTFIGHKMFVNDICFSPIKKNFVLYSGSEDGQLRVWDILFGKYIF